MSAYKNTLKPGNNPSSNFERAFFESLIEITPQCDPFVYNYMLV